MSFFLDKTVVIHKNPKLKNSVLAIVESYPVVLKFVCVLEARYGYSGNISVKNLNTGKKIEVKPHQCSFMSKIEYEVK